jgi:hypothetical protein
MALDNFGNYSSARGSKASSKFTRLKKFFLRREDDEKQFMLEKRDGYVYVRPVPKFR